MSSTDSVQITLTPAGYCEAYGQRYPFRSPGDACPLCSEPLTTLPDSTTGGPDE